MMMGDGTYKKLRLENISEKLLLLLLPLVDKCLASINDINYFFCSATLAISLAPSKVLLPPMKPAA